MMTADAVRVTTTEILEGKLRLDLLSAAVASGVVTENLGSGNYVPLILAWTLELTSPTAHMCCSPAKERRAADAKAGCCRRQSERLRHEFRNLLGRQRSEGARHSPRSADRAKASSRLLKKSRPQGLPVIPWIGGHRGDLACADGTIGRVGCSPTCGWRSAFRRITRCDRSERWRM